MSLEAHTRKVKRPRWPAGLFDWREMAERIIGELCERSGLRIEVDGASRANGGGSELHFKVAPGTAAPEEIALRLFVRKSGANKFTISYGTVNGIPVKAGSLGGPDLDEDDPYEMTVSTGYIYLVVRFSMNFVEGRLTAGFTYQGSYISSGSSMLAENRVGGVFVHEVARISAGKIVRNNEGYNLGTILYDNYTGSASDAALVLYRRN